MPNCTAGKLFSLMVAVINVVRDSVMAFLGIWTALPLYQWEWARNDCLTRDFANNLENKGWHTEGT